MFPSALFFLTIPVAAISPVKLRTPLLLMAIASGLSAVVFLFLKPRFLKPAWLQWLEDNHEQDIPLLRKEAKRMGASQWAYYVRTQADLEKWVEEVLRKHKRS